MRSTRILSVALSQAERDDPERGVSQNLENVLWCLDEAGAYDPDFVCFPELALVLQARRGEGVEYGDVAQPIPGEATDRVGEKAQDIDSYVWLPTYEVDDGHVYNSAALIDPDGDVRGTYRKAGTTVGAPGRGLTPGSEVPVWETEFGTVGCTICWDVRYPELAAALGHRNCDLMFHPTLGSGHKQLRTWALYQGFHVATASRDWARVYTQHGATRGNVAAEWRNPSFDPPTGGTARFSFVELNTDCKSYARAGSGPDTVEQIQRTYPGEVEVNAANDEGIFVLESVSEEVTVAEIAEEFGLRTIREQEDLARSHVHDAIDDSPLMRF